MHKHLARGVAVAIAATVATAACERGPGRDGEPEGPERPPAEVPVVLVHGLGGMPATLAELEARVRAEGRTPVNVALPERGNVAIDESVAAVAAAVDATGAEEVDLVGHSLGGVVARAYAVANRDRARRVVTLASPHHGAALADFAAARAPGQCTAACRQLRPSSTYLRRLNDGDETPDGVTWVTLRTAEDTTVTPVDSAELDGAVNVLVQDVCEGAEVDHGSISRDPLALGLVILALRGDLDDVPSESECERLRAIGSPAG